jgi:hypothetical protein
MTKLVEYTQDVNAEKLACSLNKLSPAERSSFVLFLIQSLFYYDKDGEFAGAFYDGLHQHFQYCPELAIDNRDVKTIILDIERVLMEGISDGLKRSELNSLMDKFSKLSAFLVHEQPKTNEPRAKDGSKKKKNPKKTEEVLESPSIEAVVLTRSDKSERIETNRTK